MAKVDTAIYPDALIHKLKAGGHISLYDDREVYNSQFGTPVPLTYGKVIKMLDDLVPQQLDMFQKEKDIELEKNSTYQIDAEATLRAEPGGDPWDSVSWFQNAMLEFKNDYAGTYQDLMSSRVTDKFVRERLEDYLGACAIICNYKGLDMFDIMEQIVKDLRQEKEDERIKNGNS